MAETSAGGGKEEKTSSSSSRLPLKERFIWLWHPHFWLTAVVVLVVIWLLTKLAS